MTNRSSTRWAIPLACTCLILLIAGALVPTRGAEYVPTVTVFVPAVLAGDPPPTSTATRVPPTATATVTATATATATVTATTPVSVCLCYADLYNCSDFSTQAGAQACFDYCYPTKGDIHRLDRDDDLVACESLP